MKSVILALCLFVLGFVSVPILDGDATPCVIAWLLAGAIMNEVFYRKTRRSRRSNESIKHI